MRTALQLLCRVIRHRMTRGELLEDILRDYPRLTEEETAVVKAACAEAAV